MPEVNFSLLDTEWAGTAASSLVREIDSRLPSEWTRHDDGPGMWRWQLEWDEDDAPLIVAVNAREDRVLAPMRGRPVKVGPTVMVAEGPREPVYSVTLPNVSDSSDLRRALSVLSEVVPALGAPAARLPEAL